MPFKIVRNDITKMKVDTIVNITNDTEEDKLRDCYSGNLELAYQNKCKSIAFQLMATESFGYQKEESMQIALDEINVFLTKHNMMVYLVVPDTATTKLGINLYPNLEAYIDYKYECYKKEARKQRGLVSKSRCFVSRSQSEVSGLQSDEDKYEDFLNANNAALKERINHMSDTFQQYLMFLIEEKKLTASEVYKKAYITKQLFSKIKLNINYHPDKATAMKLCVGAQLNIDQTKDLLGRAGYALSPCDKRDIIFSFFIENEIYDMVELDIALEERDLLGFLAC